MFRILYISMYTSSKNKSKNASKPSTYNKYFQFLHIPPNQQYPIDIDKDIPKYEKLNQLKMMVHKIENKQYITVFISNLQLKKKMKFYIYY